MKKLSLITILLLLVGTTYAQEKKEHPKPAPMTAQMTEYWEPQPKIINPSDNDVLIPAPSDAIILFDGKNLLQWQHEDNSPAKWSVESDCFTVAPGTGNIMTKKKFEDFQLHIEWKQLVGITGNSQGRGNSGVFLQGIYEIQVLDNYENETYVNGQAGSIYKQTPPLVNAMRPPGKWNIYDIIYTAPRFKENGTLLTNGYVTVIHNGIVVQNHTQIQGSTEYVGFPKVKAHKEGPIMLQDHSNKVSFRNIWIREM